MRNPRVVFEWQEARSEAARRGWETRWEDAFQRGEELSPKGQAYIEDKYGFAEVPEGYDYEEPDWYDTDDYIEY
jgi:hypothetical protein